MRKLNAPGDLPLDVFRICVGGVSDPALKSSLTAVESQIVADAVAFESRAKTQALHLIPKSKAIGPQVSKSNMSGLYEDQMVAQNSPGRIVYDRLMSSPAFGLCPLCGCRPVSTLDHHLPKSKYVSLAVNPLNLVPACFDCNKWKSTKSPMTAEEQTLHPYFDDFEGERWLHADLVQTPRTVLQFSVRRPASWSQVQEERARRHLTVFKLNLLYSSIAGQELVNIKHRLTNLFAKRGASGVREHCLEEMHSQMAAHKNSWQTAVYEALAASPWYCAGGFSTV